jgi:hypothetical protein
MAASRADITEANAVAQYQPGRRCATVGITPFAAMLN